MRVKCKLTPYIHEKKPEIEKYVNQTEWVENTLLDAVKQSDTSHALQTTQICTNEGFCLGIYQENIEF